MGELIVNGIKIAFTISMILVFTTAIITLFNILSSVVFDGIIDEIFGVVSNCLPFDLGSVMQGIGVSIAAILSFLVASKIYSLTSQRVQI